MRKWVTVISIVLVWSIGYTEQPEPELVEMGGWVFGPSLSSSPELPDSVEFLFEHDPAYPLLGDPCRLGIDCARAAEEKCRARGARMTSSGIRPFPIWEPWPEAGVPAKARWVSACYYSCSDGQTRVAVCESHPSPPISTVR